MKAIIANISILSFVMLNIALPTVDVSTDIWMIVKLFSGAYGCVNPRSWSDTYSGNIALRILKPFARTIPLEATIQPVQGQPQGYLPTAAGTLTNGRATTKTGKPAEQVPPVSAQRRRSRRRRFVSLSNIQTLGFQ